MSVTARWSGKCSLCDGLWAAGQQITKSKKGWVHPDCADYLAKTGRTPIAGTKKNRWKGRN